MERVLLGSREAKLVLVCDERTADGTAGLLTAGIEAPGLNVMRHVYEPEECGGYQALSEFFEGMAKSWRGWEGRREYYSLEGELELTAVHDGHVRMDVRLSQGFGPSLWTVEAAITIDPGEDLANAAAEVHALLGSSTSGAA